MITPRWAENVAQPHNGSWQILNLSAVSAHRDDYQPELRQRPGSIIPMANLAQSTAEMRTDSLTLIVCLDAEGKADGSLYEDEGDGFGYRQGFYRLSNITAQLNKRQLTVSLQHAEGKMPETDRTLRIGYVKNGRVQYSAWQHGCTATLRIKN